MPDSEDEWKLLCVVKGYHVYKYVWDPSQNLFNHCWMFFRGMPNFSVQWDELCGTEQRAALLHSALASNRLDICGLFTISWYMWCYLDVLLASGHCF